MAGPSSGTTKRMSADEKRKVILNIYHTTKSVYTEKEILTLAAKAGVNANTVGDINQSLIDDGLVMKEKIGGSNYYWSFPGKKDHEMQLQHEKNIETIETIKKQIQEQTMKLKEAKRGREDDDDDDEHNTRSNKLQRLRTIENDMIPKMKIELETLKENDPQAIANLEKQLQLVIQSANRWTDNILNCKSYLIKKRGMDKKEVNKILGITSNFDYPEDKIPK